eukprot:TRINITY_DN21665_c0_g1_i1.p1 TRINITY_DN21665_c0_g1~~TRINITY_DN21665_c0_g1_i1.p1  ORF type:complete len:394 (-),score=70.09 TRINITY_DN21665_c0_g1_i1:56-1237(-)
MGKFSVIIYTVVFFALVLDLGESKLIDLQTELTPAAVPRYKTRRDVKDLMKRIATETENKLPQDSTRKPVGTKTPVVGSNINVYRDHRYDKGFFSTIYDAYANHWVLKTTPEDWWFTLIRKVALDIDAYADTQVVKDFFVDHDGKKELIVDLGTSVYSANYSSFFDQMSSEIARNINDPAYVEAMSSDFPGTSTKTHKIIANIVLMSSVQEYFSYTGSILCGIPKVDMQGSEADWMKLKSKVGNLKKYLSPVINTIRGQYQWWQDIEKIVQKLLETYQGNPDVEWWQKIVTKPGSVGCGGPVTYNGWFVREFLAEQPDDLPSGLISVPMKITDGSTDEQSALVAGIPASDIQANYNEFNDTMIQAVHAWALMLEEDSVFRNDLVRRDENNEIY